MLVHAPDRDEGKLNTVGRDRGRMGIVEALAGRATQRGNFPETGLLTGSPQRRDHVNTVRKPTDRSRLQALRQGQWMRLRSVNLAEVETGFVGEDEVFAIARNGRREDTIIGG